MSTQLIVLFAAKFFGEFYHDDCECMNVCKISIGYSQDVIKLPTSISVRKQCYQREISSYMIKTS